MTRLQIILGLSFIAGSLLVSTTEIPKPSYTRTMLKVSRSLPGETEELKVRTSEGNVATLIVKRRERSGSPDEQRASGDSGERKAGNDGPGRNEDISTLLPVNAEPVSKSRKKEMSRPEVRQIEELREKTSRGNFSFPNEKTGVLDTSSDRIDVTNSSENVTNRVTTVNERIIDYGNWTPLSKDGRVLETNDGKNDKYSNWKPLKIGPEIIPNDRTNFARYKSSSNRREGSIFGRNLQDRETNSYVSDDTSNGRNAGNGPTRYGFLPHQQRPLTRTNIGANLSKNRGGKRVPPEVTIRSEIKVKSMPKRTAMSIDADGTPVIQGTRVPDEPIDKIQTWRNARVINNKLITDNPDAQNIEPSVGFRASEGAAERQRFERFFNDINRRYGRNYGEERNVYFEWDPKANQNTALNAEVYETRNDNYRSNIQKRMLHPDSFQMYPNSQMYATDSKKISPVVLKPGARAPVLQYAHPELGVQPAKILKNSEKRRPENFPENQNSFTEQKPKKKYVLNDKNVIDSYTQKNYYPNQHFYGLKQPSEQSFWVKISENLRNQFSTGVERVSQLTRPVFDPLVEATQKISQNLGLSRGKEAQDKIGTIANTGSILIPALGLVASGAALGIGAVAVGRYLDVDVLKRGRMREDGGNIGEDLRLEESRAIEAIEGSLPNVDLAMESRKDVVVPSTPAREFESRELDPTSSDDFDAFDTSRKPDDRSGRNDDSVFVILEETEGTRRTENPQTNPMVGEIGYVEAKNRRRRNVDNDDFVRIEENKYETRNERLRRTGSDSLIEIIEIDVPTKSDTVIPDRVGKFQKKDATGILAIRNNPSPTVLAGNRVDIVVTSLADLLRVRTVADHESVNGRRERESERRERRETDGDRAIDDDFQNLDDTEASENSRVDGDWTNGPCAKRIFCETMIERGPEASAFMEKKMDAVLGVHFGRSVDNLIIRLQLGLKLSHSRMDKRARIQPGGASEIASHFQEVMEAVRRHDCSSFLCPQARPTNFFF